MSAALFRLGRAAFGWNRHCEERSDEAIQRTWAPYVPLDCFAVARPERRASFDALWLAMTIAIRPKCNLV
jgi:hypothetical protein